MHCFQRGEVGSTDNELQLGGYLVIRIMENTSNVAQRQCVRAYLVGYIPSRTMANVCCEIEINSWILDRKQQAGLSLGIAGLIALSRVMSSTTYQAADCNRVLGSYRTPAADATLVQSLSQFILEGCKFETRIGNLLLRIEKLVWKVVR